MTPTAASTCTECWRAPAHGTTFPAHLRLHRYVILLSSSSLAWVKYATMGSPFLVFSVLSFPAALLYLRNIFSSRRRLIFAFSSVSATLIANSVAANRKASAVVRSGLPGHLGGKSIALSVAGLCGRRDES